MFCDYLVGIPLETILAEHGISKTTFYRRLKKVGIPKRENSRFFPLQLVLMKLAYENGESIKSIAIRHASTEITVNKALRSVDTSIRTTSEAMRLYSDADIDNAIEKYQNGLSAAEAGPSEATVLRWLKNRGIEARQQPDYGGIQDFFRVLDNQKSLYWFGFLCADGSIAKKKYVEVNLGLKDWDHLELLKKHLDYSKPIKRIEQFNKKRGKMERWANLLIGSVDMVRDLRRHGILDIKKGNPDPLERLNDEELRTFMLGYFDGDGSIYLVKPKNKLNWWMWYICCEHKTIPEYLMSRCPVVDRHNAVWSGTVWRTQYGGNVIVPRICEWLYSEATVFLKRKKILVDSIGV